MEITKCEEQLNNLLETITQAKPNMPTQVEILSRLFNSLRNSQIPVECKMCGSNGPEGNARAYITGNPLTIVMCANRLAPKEYSEALSHEATHAYDFINSKCDFSECEGLAFSEIRAARNAECSGAWPEFRRNSCIKNYATNATSNLFPGKASSCVAKMFEIAMADETPK